MSAFAGGTKIRDGESAKLEWPSVIVHGQERHHKPRSTLTFAGLVMAVDPATIETDTR